MLAVQSCFAVFIAFAYAAQPAALVELASTPVRFTTISFPFNISNTVFGGCTPLIATYLIEKTANPLALSFYIIFGAIVSLLCTFFLKESYQRSI